MNNSSNPTIIDSIKITIQLYIILLTLFSLLLFVASIKSPNKPQSVGQCIDYNFIKDISSVYVDEFYRKNSRLPSSSELKSLIKDPDKYNESPASYILFNKDSLKLHYDEIYQKFGSPPSDKAFVITCWDGDTFYSYYIPWAGDGNIRYITDSSYYIFGSQLNDLIISGSLLLAFFMLLVRKIAKLFI